MSRILIGMLSFAWSSSWTPFANMQTSRRTDVDYAALLREAADAFDLQNLRTSAAVFRAAADEMDRLNEELRRAKGGVDA